LREHQKFVFIDIAAKACTEEEISPTLRSLFLGGRGINMYLLCKNTSSRTRPLGPENPLIIGAGLLAGTPAPCGARCSLSGKSPETGLLGDSNIGGFFAARMRKAGYDHIVITGVSQTPVYIFIHDGRVFFKDASHLWGKDTLETARILEQSHGRSAQALVIGPAGENLVRFATVRHGLKNTAGRTGMGCLMGSKRIKAIVVKGTRRLSLEDPDTMRQYSRELVSRIKQTRTTEVLHRYGTPFLFDLHNRMGIVRARNGQHSVFKQARALRAAYIKRYATQSKGCFSCPIRCQHSYTFRHTDGREETVHGMEYGVLGSLGPVCGIGDTDAIFSMNDMLNRAGLDASSAGNIIAWVIELFQRGIITEADTGGLRPQWGDSACVKQLISAIIHRQGFGNLLADGARIASKALGGGTEQYLTWSKYLPQSDSVDVRAYKGFALGVATATRGGDHLRSRPTLEALNLSEDDLLRVLGEPVSGDPTSYRGKAFMVWWSEIQYALADALGICRFAQKFNSTDHLGIEEFGRLIFYATGMDLSTDELITAGERILTMERLFLQREGISRKHDSLPQRYFEPMPDGPHAGELIDNTAFNRMLDTYYSLHGWEQDTGNPTQSTIEHLNLPFGKNSGGAVEQ